MGQTTRYVLGVIGSLAYDVDKKIHDYAIKIVIDESVYNWLNQHDIEVDSDGGRTFICNAIKYKDLGLKIETDGPD